MTLFTSPPASRSAKPPDKKRKGPEGIEAKEEDVVDEASVLKRLAKRVDQLEQNAEVQDNKMRQMEDWNTPSWKVPKKDKMVEEAWKKLGEYKATQVAGQAHPDGPARVKIAEGILNWVERERKKQMCYSSTS